MSMITRTRAAVVRQAGGSFTFEDVDIEPPRSDEVLVRIVACGICHTDIAARDGLFATPFPAVFGHEGVGVVERMGGEGTRICAGDRVVLSFSSCGECPSCCEGHPAHCAVFDELNFGDARINDSDTIRNAKGERVSACFFGQSSLAYHALTRRRNLIPVDVGSDDELALLAPLGCGVQAGAGTVLNELKPGRNENVVVFGAGTVGLAAVMAARLAGADPIVAVDIVPSRLVLARELGATITINSLDENVDEQLKEMIGEIDHAVETTGKSQVIEEAMRCLGPSGKLSLLGVSTNETSLAFESHGPQQRVFYSIAGDSNPARFIPFLIQCHREGKFPFHKLIREYSASEINRAVKDSLEGVTVKPVLRF